MQRCDNCRHLEFHEDGFHNPFVVCEKEGMVPDKEDVGMLEELQYGLNISMQQVRQGWLGECGKDCPVWAPKQ